MDENSEPSWTEGIRTAVREFVDAVNESSKQLASASEQFALESLKAATEAREQSEQSAASSAAMAEQARQAAEEARSASSALQSTVDEARLQIRDEVSQSLEQVSSQTAHLNELGDRLKNDLQQQVDAMVGRLEAGAAGHSNAAETAQAATAAAQAAAERIETSVKAVEAAVASARQAADEARRAADESQQNLGNAANAMNTAHEAAEASRQSASLAEQAGKRSDFAAEAGMLLERLETDYTLLTRLVQELHTRITSLSGVTFEPPAPAFESEPEDLEIPENDESYADATGADEPGAYAPAPVDQPSRDAEREPPGPSWPAQPAATTTPQAADNAPPTAPSSPSITIAGRVQMKISPVPDFDRLLSLDSALARVSGVKSVTLADYAREEVVFRVELEQPVSVIQFAGELGETAGVGTEVTEASESTLSIRVS